MLKRFAYVLDLDSDLNRSASDTRFWRGHDQQSEAERRIYYVFDENIFELFIDPWKYGRYCENFYLPMWGGADSDSAANFTAQTGLITAEYLFSNRLPGILENDPIFMTEWHFTELKGRLARQRMTLRREVQKLGDTRQKIDEYLEEYRGRQDFQASAIEDLGRALADGSTDPLTAKDVRKFLSEEKDPDAALRFVVARELAERLVRDRVVEPLQQLDRVYSEIFARLQPLSFRFRSEPNDAPALEKLIAEWIKILSTLHEDSSNSGRIEFDAKSIAHVHWVARHKLTRDERIVLVTGDAKLFNAYRRWQAQQAIGEGFLLRRVKQYIPLINPHDTPNDMVGASSRGIYLFDGIRRAMDAPTLSFRLSENEQGQNWFADFLLAQKSPEKTPQVELFSQDFSASWWKERDTSFRDLRDQWREAERLAIGASFPILDRRLNTRQSMLAEIAVHGGSARSSDAFGRYLIRLLEAIEARGLEVDFPDAVDFVAGRGEWRNRKIAREARRAPLDIRLAVPIPGRPGEWIQLADIIEGLVQSDPATLALVDALVGAEDAPPLRERKDLLFGIASALALRKHIWAEAARFAENAASAIKGADNVDTVARAEARMEYVYLAALAKRFLVAQVSPAMIRENDDAWLAHLDDAVRQLNEAEAYHRQAAEGRRLLRAISERAAIRLFYATWLAVLPQTVLRESGYQPEVGVEQYNAGLKDLRAGWRVIEKLEHDGVFCGGHLLHINAAAYALIGRLLANRGVTVNTLTEQELDAIETLMEGFRAFLPDYPSIASLDLYGFLAVVRGREDAVVDLWRILDTGVCELPLDLAVDAELRRNLGPRPKSAGPPPAAQRKPRRRRKPRPRKPSKSKQP